MNLFVIMRSYILFLTVFSPCLAIETSSAPKDPATFDVDQGLYLQLLRRVENLEKRDQEQQVEINSLREELNTEKIKTERLENRLFRLQASLGKRRGDTDDNHVHVVRDALSKQHSQRIVRNADGDTAEGKRSNEATDVRPSRIQRQAETPVVAFHAHVGEDINHAGVHQIIVFEDVQTNLGNAYNPHFGSFIAPVSGVYVFHTTIRSPGQTNTYVTIVKNGVVESNLWIDRYNESVMIVLHLNKGDDVAVRNERADKAIGGSGSSMFSGFLLHQDYTNASIVG